MEWDNPQIIGALSFGLVMLVVLLFVLGLVWGLTRMNREKAKPPEEQLAGRFARGEISEGEYLRNLAILQHGNQFVLEADRAPAPLEPRTAAT
jgi:uncharacterized membrane protein